jgi:hypothetical protein
MMAAVAHSLDDEPIDPAEEPMTAAAFEVIQHAHQLCGHPAARELSAEPELEQHTEQELNEARAILRDLLVTDWQQVAADAWNEKGWKDAAVEYRTKRGTADAGVRR